MQKLYQELSIEVLSGDFPKGASKLPELRNFYFQIYLILASESTFGFEEAFREGNFSNFFFKFSKFYIFLVITRSWGVHRHPWF